MFGESWLDYDDDAMINVSQLVLNERGRGVTRGTEI